MPKEIVKTQETALVEKRSMLKKAQALMADSMAFGLKRLLYYGAALYNIKENDLFMLDEDTPTWKAYCESIGLDRSDAHRYVGIGAAIHEHLVTSAIDRGSEFPLGFILQKDLEALYRDRLDALRGLTFRQLADLSKRLDIFQEAMTGAEIQKLLPEASDKNAVAETAKRNDLADFNEHMKKVCAAQGLVWNAKLKRAEHEDGTLATDDEIAQITPPSVAASVWRDIQHAVDKMTEAIALSIKTKSKSYLLYAKAVPNAALQKEVDAVREHARERFEEVNHILDALIASDIERVKEIQKHGLEE